MILWLIALSSAVVPGLAFAKQFEVFDGQVYNGQFYPRVDIIEWQESDAAQPHMEFHFYSKRDRIDLSVVPGDKNGRPVLWLMFDLGFRGERICRHTVAPVGFREGQPLYAFIEDKDPDYYNIKVFSDQRPMGKSLPYRMPDYRTCEDSNASNRPEPKAEEVVKGASTNDISVRGPASPIEAAPPGEKSRGGNLTPDYEHNAVPFSF
jgi:hypothetical protein